MGFETQKFIFYFLLILFSTMRISCLRKMSIGRWKRKTARRVAKYSRRRPKGLSPEKTFGWHHVPWERFGSKEPILDSNGRPVHIFQKMLLVEEAGTKKEMPLTLAISFKPHSTAVKAVILPVPTFKREEVIRHISEGASIKPEEFASEKPKIVKLVRVLAHNLGFENAERMGIIFK